ncbi:MAG: hypothetical protein HYR56_17805 [Acidobacteria bacterium]|nr:hypothetical protein [Acidobacteriota bacterium]MBI3424054.1 hypothetical protein [Acidobacteriota bacterium]
MQTEVLIERIKSLPPNMLVEVEALVDSLESKSGQAISNARQARFDAIAAYAAQHAGTDADLDEELEQAAVEHLLTLEEYEQ